jgi:1-acyl-sn-glycerol-3-phosphate acyltransferase
VIDVDYKEYLGPKYKDDLKEVKYVSTMICNHVSWVDSQVLYKYFSVAFIISKEFKSIPIFSTLAKIIDSLFIERGSSKEKRD